MDVSSINSALAPIALSGVATAGRTAQVPGREENELTRIERVSRRTTDSAEFSESAFAALAGETEAGEEPTSIADRIAAAAGQLNSQGSGESSRTDQAGETELTEEEREQVRELRARDSEVRAHEQAHSAAAGSLANGGPSYETQEGPDGNSYAVGGEVSISLESGSTPEESVRLADQARRAALAPATPSAQDRSVAAQASQMATAARAETAASRSEAASGEEQSQEIIETEISAAAQDGAALVEQSGAALDGSPEHQPEAGRARGTEIERSAGRDEEVAAARSTERAQAQRTRAYGQVTQAAPVSNLLGALFG